MIIDGPSGFPLAALDLVCDRYGITLEPKEVDNDTEWGPRPIGQFDYQDRPGIVVSYTHQKMGGALVRRHRVKKLKILRTGKCPRHRWSTTDVVTLLHEACHIVCGRPSLVIDEQVYLLQFECSLARWLVKQAPSERVAKNFMEHYWEFARQSEIIVNDKMSRPKTQKLIDLGIVAEQFEPFEEKLIGTDWWNAGIARCVRLGLLTVDGEPTWRRARYYGIHIKTWPVWP